MVYSVNTLFYSFRPVNDLVSSSLCCFPFRSNYQIFCRHGLLKIFPACKFIAYLCRILVWFCYGCTIAYLLRCNIRSIFSCIPGQSIIISFIYNLYYRTSICIYSCLTDSLWCKSCILFCFGLSCQSGFTWQRFCFCWCIWLCTIYI